MQRACRAITALLMTGFGLINTTVTIAENSKPDAKNPNIHRAAQACNEFAIDVFKYLPSREKNVCFSPPSLTCVLGMLELGAKGETRDEIRKALHLAEGASANPTDLGLLIPFLNQNGNGFLLKSANRLWISNRLMIDPRYDEAVSKTFHAKTQLVDFRDGTVALEEINDWVDDNTNSKIPKLFATPLATNTELLLTNAVYFRGTWKQQFDPKETRQRQFTTANDKKLETPMMFQSEKFRLWNSKELQVLELPYHGDSLSAFFILPTNVAGLGELERALTARNFDTWITATQASKVVTIDVYLPSFKVESSLELEAPLKKLGIASPWNRGANFTGITDAELQLSRVVQKTLLQVDEKGTTAAAATGGIVAASASPTFRCNHPFLMAIRENVSGLIMFLGRINDPTETK